MAATGLTARCLFSGICSLSSETHARKLHENARTESELLIRPGDHSVRAPPGSIPNPAVKPHSAQGTALLRVGERVVARSDEQLRPVCSLISVLCPLKPRVLPAQGWESGSPPGLARSPGNREQKTEIRKTDKVVAAGLTRQCPPSRDLHDSLQGS